MAISTRGHLCQYPANNSRTAPLHTVVHVDVEDFPVLGRSQISIIFDSMGRSGFLLFVLIAFCVIGCTSSEDDVLYIATAANVQFAMDDLTAMFSEETGIPCEIILGSSGKLMAQIREGAPYHVFVSADMKYPVTLFNDGLTTARPDIYANGSLVLWTLDDRLPSIEILRSGEVSKIALANPSTAPYGRAASQALEFYGMDMEVADKLVYGESISQTNQFIISGSAQVGFTAKSAPDPPRAKSPPLLGF